ncbi:alpha/beta fold hydrolase [Longispora fulva]|uniref:Pimeloyl-ACP methyl ester carboxylesterase n=1 Tax=Longispora fulva TaxID=619741 RepID=A0A8J7H089_9ACTN|nr:alpha/beta fold hydrolase [Longispora fulva]MBG6141751.1 pimeloyl-ACP methyl ester carboxylesterase [Longispora fulva]
MTFRTLDTVAPAAAVALAERLWCTIPKGPVRPFDTPGEQFVVPVDGRAVVVESWGEGPIVYLLHGWGGWRGQFGGFLGPLLDAGFRVVALDAPGHGDSAPGAFGKGRGLLPELSVALTRVVEAVGPAHAVIGHSLGGSAAAIAVLDGLRTEHLVLVAAAADPIPYTRDFAAAFGISEAVRTGFLTKLERRVKRRMSDFDIPARARAAVSALPKALVVHDAGDKEVRHSDAGAVVAAWPGADLWSTEGLGHRRILRAPEVVAGVVSRLAGSGAAPTAAPVEHEAPAEPGTRVHATA